MGYAHKDLTIELKQTKYISRDPDAFPRFISTIQPGMKFKLLQQEVGIQQDDAIPEPLIYTVVKLRRWNCELQRVSPRGFVHSVSIGYNSLYVYQNHTERYGMYCGW